MNTANTTSNRGSYLIIAVWVLISVVFMVVGRQFQYTDLPIRHLALPFLTIWLYLLFRKRKNLLNKLRCNELDPIWLEFVLRLSIAGSFVFCVYLALIFCNGALDSSANVQSEAVITSKQERGLRRSQMLRINTQSGLQVSLVVDDQMFNASKIGAYLPIISHQGFFGWEGIEIDNKTLTH